MVNPKTLTVSELKKTIIDRKKIKYHPDIIKEVLGYFSSSHSIKQQYEGSFFVREVDRYDKVYHVNIENMFVEYVNEEGQFVDIDGNAFLGTMTKCGFVLDETELKGKNVCPKCGGNVKKVVVFLDSYDFCPKCK